MFRYNYGRSPELVQPRPARPSERDRQQEVLGVAHVSESEVVADDEQELSRVTVVVGAVSIDVGLPARVSVSAIVDDVIDLANRRTGPDGPVFDDTEGRWTLARLSGDPLDPDRSLVDAGVTDGELLMVCEAGAPTAGTLVDDIDSAVEGSLVTKLWPAIRNGLPVLVSTAAAALLPGLPATEPFGLPVPALAMLVVGLLGAVIACLPSSGRDDAPRSVWGAAAALPLIFGASLQLIPGVRGMVALPAALAVTALVSLLVLLATRRGWALHTAVIATAIFGAPAALASTHFASRSVGAVLATVAVIVVYLAPRATILLAKLPLPRVPTAGEPLDDIETQGPAAVEGVSAVGRQVIPTEAGVAMRVERARAQLLGLVAAAALLAVVGSFLALGTDTQFYWQGVAFAIAVATVLCLRGRSHHDVAQAGVLVGGGLVTAVTAIVTTAAHVSAWQVNAALALAALTALIIAVGLVAPRLEFSPVARRWVEIGEYLSIAMVFPLACWILGVYAFFRELRL
jgi:type VII secretion integral membrane protein EccD